MSHPEEQETYIKARKEIYDIVKDIPSLTNKQLDEHFSTLHGSNIPNSNREWKIEAVVRMLQNKYYSDRDIPLPEKVKNNFDSFFKSVVPKKKKRKTPKKESVVNRPILNDERARVLHLVANLCAEIVPNGSSSFHPTSKYGSVKSGKTVVMFIEKKLRKIVVFMGGERDRRNHPKLNIFIGVDDEDIKPALNGFIHKHLSNFSHCRDKRWKKCEYVLEEVTKSFKKNLNDFNDFHAHPTGRYTTFKKGRLVLVFITQDRAKGEVAFHPGGERESNPNTTTTIKVSEVKNDSEIESAVVGFINTHYAKYMKEKDKNKASHKKEMQKILDICKHAVICDEVFHHPDDFFGLIKNIGRPIVMIKRSKKKEHYDIIAWVKKQKGNPSITIKISDPEEEIKKAVEVLVDKYIE